MSSTSTVSIATTRRRQRPARVWRRIFANPLGAASFGILLAIVVACFGAALWAPYDPLANDLAASLQGPSPEHLLGTDQLGRDILSRLLWGGQPALLSTAVVVVTALLIGVPLGMAAGFNGGRLDQFVMRMSDLVMAMPAMIIVLLVLAVFGSGSYLAFVALGLLLVPTLTRIIRANTLSVRTELFIDAARVSGVSTTSIVLRHVTPRILGAVLVQATLTAAVALLFTTGLAYLGFGVTAPAPTWGTMVAESAQLIRQNPLMLTVTGGLIGLTVLCLGVFGDIVRDAIVERWSSFVPVRSRRRSKDGTTWARRSNDDAMQDAGLPSIAADAQPVPAEDAVLSARRISIAYGAGETATTVVDEVSFEIRPGEVVGLVGESGCGKSTVARAVLGLLRGGGRIMSGQVLFEGHDLAGLSAAQLREHRGSGFAFVSQEPMVALDPTRRVGDTVTDAVRKFTGLSRRAARERTIDLFRQVHFNDPERVFRSYPHEISGGMAQRIAIARALAGDPRLLIADEPTTALDVTVQAEILDLLRSLRDERGLAILIVTHDWGVVADLCDRAVVMYAGQVVEQATVRALYHSPLHPYTLGLLAANPSLAPDGDGDLRTIAGSIPAPSDWPHGCRFAARCPLAEPECLVAPVPLVRVDADRTSRCRRIDATAGCDHDLYAVAAARTEAVA